MAQSCPTLCDPMNCSTPGLPVHHHLPEFTQTHVHCTGDAIQPAHPLSTPSPAFSLSQHQGLFRWVGFASGGQSTVVAASASALPMNIQDRFPLGWTGWISLMSKGLSSLPQHSIITHWMYFLPLLMHLFSYKILYIFDSSFDKAYDIHTICRMFFLKS